MRLIFNIDHMLWRIQNVYDFFWKLTDKCLERVMSTCLKCTIIYLSYEILDRNMSYDFLSQLDFENVQIFTTRTNIRKHKL